MDREYLELDDILSVESGSPQAPSEEPEQPAAKPEKKKKKEKKKKRGSRWGGFFRGLGKLLLILVETALLIVFALYGVMYVLAKGPSSTARNLFVMSVRETSAVGFLADIFFTEEEIAEIEGARGEEEYVEVDTSLITITTPTEPDPESDGPTVLADAWGYVDEDGDGIIVEPVTGEGFTGYMMIVLDPSRVIMGSVPESLGGRGYTVQEMAEYYDAVAGINAGGFEDPDGKGNGSIPSTMLVFEGKVHYGFKGVQDGFVGFDSNYVMHVGKFTEQDVIDKDIQYGVAFGPVLIVNGEPVDSEKLASGINPRTAIGQRSDGAVLLLVVDGRQASTLGCTWLDLVDIFMEFGAVNACNLDGGSSTLMWYNGEYINNCASVIGIRPVPTTFLVLKEGAQNNG